MNFSDKIINKIGDAKKKKQSEKQTHDKFNILITIAIICITGFAIYSNTFHASFAFDDYKNIVENTEMQDGSIAPQLNKPRYFGLVSFAINYDYNKFNMDPLEACRTCTQRSSYVYVQQNPVNYVDYSGQFTFIDLVNTILWIALIAAVVYTIIWEFRHTGQYTYSAHYDPPPYNCVMWNSNCRDLCYCIFREQGQNPENNPLLSRCLGACRFCAESCTE